MAGTIVEPTKTNHGEITLDLSAAAGPAEGRGGGDSGRDVPSRRISPFTLLSYEEGYHSRWPQGRFFFSSCIPNSVGILGKGGRMKGWMGGGEGSMRCKGRPPAR